jgi:hypothetical protein
MTTGKKKPRLVLRPYFDMGLNTVYAFIAAGVSLAVVPIVFGTVLYVLFLLLGLGAYVSAGFIYASLFVLCLAFTPAIFFEVRKRALKRTFFAFYDDHLDFEYWQFYLQPRRGRLRYAEIQDVFQQAGTLQAQRMLTSLFLHVPGLAQRMGRQGGFSGLVIPDLKQSASNLSRVTDIIEAVRAA